MAKKKEEQIDPKVLAMLGKASDFDADSLESEGFDNLNVNAITLPEGSSVRGTLLAVGGFDVIDQKTKQPKHVVTYEIETSSGKILISAGAVLESKMKHVNPGQQVAIARLANVKSSSGNDMGDYRVFAK